MQRIQTYHFGLKIWAAFPVVLAVERMGLRAQGDPQLVQYVRKFRNPNDRNDKVAIETAVRKFGHRFPPISAFVQRAGQMAQTVVGRLQLAS